MAWDRAGPLGQFLLFVQPSSGANLCPAAHSPKESRHVERGGLADEYLARKIQAHATVLQAPFQDTALKDRALALAGASKLIAAAAAGSSLKGVTVSAVAAADGRQTPAEAITPAHARLIAPSVMASSSPRAVPSVSAAYVS